VIILRGADNQQERFLDFRRILRDYMPGKYEIVKIGIDVAGFVSDDIVRSLQRCRGPKQQIV
jgi:hypothetical protein